MVYSLVKFKKALAMHKISSAWPNALYTLRLVYVAQTTLGTVVLCIAELKTNTFHGTV